MSIHDGPGIHSAIFFKGCNLRCEWCHNPETFISKPELEWLPDKCINCLVCTLLCETGAKSEIDSRLAINKSNYIACFNCTEVCYPEALHKVGKDVSSEQLYNDIESGLPYCSLLSKDLRQFMLDRILEN